MTDQDGFLAFYLSFHDYYPDTISAFIFWRRHGLQPWFSEHGGLVVAPSSVDIAIFPAENFRPFRL